LAQACYWLKDSSSFLAAVAPEFVRISRSFWGAMMFAQEDILHQKPIVWFPGMAGATEGATECFKEEPKEPKLVKSDFNRFESQASTTAPDAADHYFRSISDDAGEPEKPKQRDQEQEVDLSEEEKAILQQEEHDDETAMLWSDFGFGGTITSLANELARSADPALSVTLALLALFWLASIWSLTDSAFVQMGWAALVMATLTLLARFRVQSHLKTSQEVSPYRTE